MAWGSSKSTSAEYRHTAGSEYACTKFSAAWDRVTGGESEGTRVFEEIAPPVANPKLDHVLVYCTPKLAVDSDVPRLVENSAQWEAFVKTVPGFTIQMLRVAELLYKTDWYLTRKLNALLISQGTGHVSHVSEGISVAQDTLIRPARRAAFISAITEVFKPFAEDQHQITSAMLEWFTCYEYMHMRNSVGHPLGTHLNSISNLTLAEFKTDVENNPEYAPVKSAALVMIKVAEQMLADGNAFSL